MDELTPKQYRKAKDGELHNLILLALGGYELNLDFEAVKAADKEKNLDDLKDSSEFRKLRWAVKSGMEYVVVYIQTSDKEESDGKSFFNKFRTKYGSSVSWKKSVRKYSETKVVSCYQNEVLEYREVTTVDSLKFMVIPIHLWNDALRSQDSIIISDGGKNHEVT